MFPFLRKNDPHALAQGMAGAKLGDRVAFIGCGDGGRLAAIAAKVGLSGRAAAVVADQAAAARVQRSARQAGVLIEVEIAPLTALPLEAGAFDLAVIDDTDFAFARLGDAERNATAGEALRVLRAGGRLLVMSAGEVTGLSAVLSRGPRGPIIDPQPAMRAAGVTGTRLLGEREGLRFFEGTRSR